MNKCSMKAFAVITLIALSGVTLAGDPADAKAATGKKPLKVYILAGQSNMQGTAMLWTVPRMALSPETKELHDKILDEAGKPREHKNVSIVYFTDGDVHKGKKRDLVELKGLLKAGVTGCIGPELGFGITMGEATDPSTDSASSPQAGLPPSQGSSGVAGGPILIIKTAWGGKSLNTQFRPPSAGALPVQRDKKATKDWSEEQWNEFKAKQEATQGAYYRLMMELVNSVLADPGKYCAAYDPAQGYEIAGFGWFQGFNDRFYYPGSYDYYTETLAHFIRDVRKELKAPKMPFAIGVIGINGNNEKDPKELELRKAMAATALIPEFKGNVTAVETAGFWDDEMMAALERVNQSKGLWGSSDRWTAVGTPVPEERVWHYTSFNLDEEKQFRNLRPGEAGDERTLTGETPAGMEGWLNPDFDVTAWQKGPAPIFKGARPGKPKKGEVTDKTISGSPWGDGNMLLAKTTIQLDRTDISHYRLCIKGTGSFMVYLNGNLIKNYPWWNKGDNIRKFDFDSKHVKQGANELAFYGNINLGYNAVDMMLEGLPKTDADAILEKQKTIATPRDYALSKGKSNQEYHYMGSAYTYSRVGEALAKAIIEMQKEE